MAHGGLRALPVEPLPACSLFFYHCTAKPNLPARFGFFVFYSYASVHVGRTNLGPMCAGNFTVLASWASSVIAPCHPSTPQALQALANICEQERENGSTRLCEFVRFLSAIINYLLCSPCLFIMADRLYSIRSLTHFGREECAPIMPCKPSSCV